MADQTPSNTGSDAGIVRLDEFCNCTDKCTCPGEYRAGPVARNSQLRELCRTLWPDAIHEKTVFGRELDHDFNLHYPVGLTYEDEGKENLKFVVVQIPLYHEDVEKYAQNLRYLDKFPGIRSLVPKVLQFDTTRDNPLGRPYLVRSSLAGKPLNELYNKMTPEEKVLVAAELGRTWLKLEGVGGLYSGSHVPIGQDEEAEEDDEVAPQYKSMMRIKPFGLVEDEYNDKLDWDKIRDSIAQGEDKDRDQVLDRFNLLEDMPAMTAREILLLTFERRIQRNRHWANRAWENDHLEPALEIVRDLVNNEANAAGKPVVAGLADWHFTEWAPRFTTCQPPAWLWTPGAVHDAENPIPETHDFVYPKREPLDAVQPVHDAGQAVKRAFDDAAGQYFQAAAYNPDAVFARRYFVVAADNTGWSSCELKELDYLAREWVERKARHDRVFAMYLAAARRSGVQTKPDDGPGCELCRKSIVKCGGSGEGGCLQPGEEIDGRAVAQKKLLAAAKKKLENLKEVARAISEL
ncbi:hypothetical protein PG991_001830 [Apiospora marii]|uniref:Aminoglycoside phosphotransferase domain-containing protein n=1 Tax=Apiospora marii TaxID=335849 RepID=A0ABR1SN82_9PEZI